MRLFVTCLVLMGGSSVSKAQSKSDTFDYPFKLGEKLAFTMSYGWFDIGRAEVFIDEEFWLIRDTPHYYVQFQLKTLGVFNFLAKLNVCMDSWIDAKTLRPLLSSREVSFGNKIDIRTDQFEYEDSVQIAAYVEDVDSHRFHQFPNTDVPILDVLSTYLYLRNGAEDIPNDSLLAVQTFFSNDLYPFGMISGVIEKTSINETNYLAQRYELLLPESDVFSSGKMAYVLASKDSLCLPLIFSIEMKYGDFKFELVDYQRP